MQMIVGDGERRRFKKAVVERAVSQCLAEAARRPARWLEEQIEEAVFWETKRLEESRRPSKADREFWRKIRKSLLAGDNPVPALQRSVSWYVDEIQGVFKPPVYRIVSSLFPYGLGLLFSNEPGKSPAETLASPPTLDRNIRIDGEVEAMRRLARRGTLIAAPTHGSNTDSMVIGYALHQMGLPPFNYGAGLNLFENKMMGYFMNSLGAYKVDRKKKESLYKNTLKHYSELLLENGFHSLFFPGGTRSRNGRVERKLKLGLLGTGVTAYINNLRAGKPDPDIFVVPIAISYHLVLEAETLIEDWLKEAGKTRYIIDDDEFANPNELFKFVSRTLRYNSKIYFYVCPPLDLFGNRVNEEGVSLDPHGRPVDRRAYTLIDGKPAHSPQRDEQYTRELGEALCESFSVNARILVTHVLASAAMRALRERHPDRDIYRLMRLDRDELTVPLERLIPLLDETLKKLRALEREGRVALGDEVKDATAVEALEAGARYFDIYPEKKALRREGDRFVAENPALLLYYAERADDYFRRWEGLPAAREAKP